MSRGSFAAGAAAIKVDLPGQVVVLAGDGGLAVASSGVERADKLLQQPPDRVDVFLADELGPAGFDLLAGGDACTTSATTSRGDGTSCG